MKNRGSKALMSVVVIKIELVVSMGPHRVRFARLSESIVVLSLPVRYEGCLSKGISGGNVGPRSEGRRAKRKESRHG